jgi:hypothetical protein
MYATEINGGDLGGNADPIVARYRANVAAFGFEWQLGVKGCFRFGFKWSTGDMSVTTARMPWGTGARALAAHELAWQGWPDSLIESAFEWEKAENANDDFTLPWVNARLETIQTGMAWEDSPDMKVPIHWVWQATARAARPVVLPWGNAQALAQAFNLPFLPCAKHGKGWRLPWQKAGRPLWYYPQLIIRPDDPDQGGGHDPETGTWIIFRKRAYRMFHDISLKRLPDMLPIPVSGLSFTMTADSPHITFSASVIGREAFASVLASESTGEILVQADIDGLVFNSVLDPASASRSFANDSYSISGRSLSWYLGNPFSKPRDRTNGDDSTAQQLALAELDGLLTTGWTVTWPETGDWAIPAGAFSYANLTPIQAIQQLADAGGLMVVPSLTGKALDVRFRYPVLPWDYAATTPDLIIPTSAALSIPQKYYEPYDYANAVYVVGGSVGGVMARVWRSGTAGDQLMQQVQNNLATDATTAYNIGKRALASQWKQPIIREIEIPFDNVSFPIAELGQLVKVQDSEDGNVYGIVSAVTISVTVQDGGMVEVSQSIRLGENSGDPLALFHSILPADPLLFGTVASTHADGTLTVVQPGGGLLRVRNSGIAVSVSDTVFVKSGMVVSVAPSMTLYELEA